MTQGHPFKALANCLQFLTLYTAVLLYCSILSNTVFFKPKTALNFYLTQFIEKFSKKKKKKKTSPKTITLSVGNFGKFLTLPPLKIADVLNGLYHVKFANLNYRLLQEWFYPIVLLLHVLMTMYMSKLPCHFSQ